MHKAIEGIPLRPTAAFVNGHQAKPWTANDLRKKSGVFIEDCIRKSSPQGPITYAARVA